MKITFNGTEFTEISAIIDGERISGLMIHDLNDSNCDGDAVCTNSASFPESADDAANLLANETWMSDSEIIDTVKNLDDFPIVELFGLGINAIYNSSKTFEFTASCGDVYAESAVSDDGRLIAYDEAANAWVQLAPVASDVL